MKNITLNQLRDLADELGVSSKKSSDGDMLLAGLNADDAFSHDVCCVFSASEQKLEFQAYAAPDFDGPRSRRAEALEFCNEWNAEKVVPKAFVDSDGDLRVEAALFTDVDVSEEYVKENFVRLAMATAWNFFVEAGKKFA